MKYRHEAKQNLENAKASLSNPGLVNAKYGALSLRMSVEALTYDLADKYQDDMPLSIIDTWQPRKIMAEILEIDPYAGRPSTLSYGREPALGKTPEVFREIGTETPISLEVIKKHYHALGSFLHLPTLRQIKSDRQQDEEKIRRRCNELIGGIEKILSSTAWNINMGNTSTMKCECGESLTRRLKKDGKPRDTQCPHCHQSYRLTDIGDGKCEWEPHTQKITCPNEDCKTVEYVGNHLITPGNEFICDTCNKKYKIALGVSPIT